MLAGIDCAVVCLAAEVQGHDADQQQRAWCREQTLNPAGSSCWECSPCRSLHRNKGFFWGACAGAVITVLLLPVLFQAKQGEGTNSLLRMTRSSSRVPGLAVALHPNQGAKPSSSPAAVHKSTNTKHLLGALGGGVGDENTQSATKEKPATSVNPYLL